MIFQSPTNWFSKPRSRKTSQASSIETAFMRRRMSSATLGRPSEERSPFQDAVIANRSAFEAAIPLGRSSATASEAMNSHPGKTAHAATLAVAWARVGIIVEVSRVGGGEELAFQRDSGSAPGRRHEPTARAV